MFVYQSHLKYTPDDSAAALAACWVFVYKGLASLLRTESVTKLDYYGNVTLSVLSRIAQGWLDNRFRLPLPWKN